MVREIQVWYSQNISNFPNSGHPYSFLIYYYICRVFSIFLVNYYFEICVLYRYIETWLLLKEGQVAIGVRMVLSSTLMKERRRRKRSNDFRDLFIPCTFLKQIVAGEGVRKNEDLIIVWGNFWKMQRKSFGNFNIDWIKW